MNDEETNREIVRRAFEEWARGGEDFFDLLSPDVTWTIMGSGPSARTYRGKQRYIEAAVEPLLARLSEPILPHLLELWAVQETVIARWDQDTATRDGKQYRNSYAWFFKMRDDKVIEVTAFLDLPAYDALIAGGERATSIEPAAR